MRLAAPSLGRQRSERRLFLLLQPSLVLLDERPDVIGHVEQLQPLLLVQRHGEPTEAVDRDASLLANLHRDALVPPRLQRLVLGLEALQLGPEFVFGAQVSASLMVAVPSATLRP